MRFVIPMAAFVAMWSIPAFGMDIVINPYTSPPSSNIEISQTTLSDYSNPNGRPFEAIRKTAANNVSAWREVGQTFTVSSTFTLDKITLMVSQSDAFVTNWNPPNDMNLSIDVWSSTNLTDPTGTSLAGYPASGAAYAPDIPFHSGNPPPNGPETALPDSADLIWMTFDVPNVELTSGFYGFRVGFDYPGYSGGYQLGSSGLDVGGIYMNRDGNPYADGQMFRYHPYHTTGNGVANIPDTDLVFYIQSATPQLGDFNVDSKVDAGDYITWRMNEIANSSLPNDDGLTTQSDRYDLWRENFGLPSAASSTLGGVAVPEPSTGVLTVAGVWLIAAIRRSAGRAG